MEPPWDCKQAFQEKLCRPEWNSLIYSKYWIKKFQSRILYPAKLSLRTERAYSKQEKAKEFITTKLALQELLKELIKANKKGH